MVRVDQLSQGQIRVIQEAFALCDSNGDSTIATKDLRVVLRAMGLASTAHVHDRSIQSAPLTPPPCKGRLSEPPPVTEDEKTPMNQMVLIDALRMLVVSL
jgi:hypothetical protein